MKITAILSTTVLPTDGLYDVKTLKSVPGNLNGAPHYVGHPATKKILESMGAVPSPDKLFVGLRVGEVALAFSIAPGKGMRCKTGYSVHHQDVTIDDLMVRKITRVA